MVMINIGFGFLYIRDITSTVTIPCPRPCPIDKGELKEGDKTNKLYKIPHSSCRPPCFIVDDKGGFKTTNDDDGKRNNIRINIWKYLGIL